MLCGTLAVSARRDRTPITARGVPETHARMPDASTTCESVSHCFGFHVSAESIAGPGHPSEGGRAPLYSESLSLSLPSPPSLTLYIYIRGFPGQFN